MAFDFVWKGNRTEIQSMIVNIEELDYMGSAPAVQKAAGICSKIEKYRHEFSFAHGNA